MTLIFTLAKTPTHSSSSTKNNFSAKKYTVTIRAAPQNNTNRSPSFVTGHAPMTKSQKNNYSARKKKQLETDKLQNIEAQKVESKVNDNKLLSAQVKKSTSIQSEELSQLSRRKAEDADLEHLALLISKTFEVTYTQEAEDEGFEGAAYVEVLVNFRGKPLEARLKRRLGFGMDKKVIQGILNAKFKPGINKRSQPVTSWTTVQLNFKLQ